MKEILFRGKRVDNGEWVEGFYCEKVNKTFFSPAEDSAQIIDKDLWWHEVTSETVGQYTGLVDKNGKKIFEGDILDCGDRVVFVEWHSNCGTWDSKFIKYKGELCSNGITPVEWQFRAIIIGNIHDNPELLEVHNG